MIKKKNIAYHHYNTKFLGILSNKLFASFSILLKSKKTIFNISLILRKYNVRLNVNIQTFNSRHT